MSVSFRENYIGKFKDERISKRADKLSALLFFGGSVSLHKISNKDAELKAAYRLLRNQKFREDIITEAVTEKSAFLSEGRDVLVIQDTTEINLNKHRGRLKPNQGIGLTGNNHDKGFFAHCSIVIDAESEAMLGFSHVKLWDRPKDKEDKDTRDYPNLPIGKKESFKWIEASDGSKKHLSKARSITIIEDREGDIFEQFAQVPDERTHLIIRSRDNRNLADGGKLFDRLKTSPVVGSYSIDLVKDIREGIEKQTIKVAVRFCKVNIARPKRLKDKALPDSIELYAVEVRQIDGPEVGGVLWRILTTHPVKNYKQAVAIVNRYRQRWHIEQLFRLLKKKGFDIESSELETGWAIRKLTVMTLNTALRVMQLKLAYNNDESQPITDVFNEDQISCLQAANKSLEGHTPKTKNSSDPQTLAWASYVIGRLGGWKPYDSRPPGPIILKRGLDRFEILMQGWNLARKKDVS